MNQKLSVLDTPIFHKMYSLYKTLSSYHKSIPKAKRYTLWQRCENISLSLLQILVSTDNQKGEEKLQSIYKISDNVILLEVLIRLAKETKTISPEQCIEIQEIFQEIDKMIEELIKSISN